MLCHQCWLSLGNLDNTTGQLYNHKTLLSGYFNVTNDVWRETISPFLITPMCWSYKNRLNLVKWGELLQLLACQWYPRLGAGPHKPQKLRHEHDLAIPYANPTTSWSMSTMWMLCRGQQDKKSCTRRSKIADQNVHSHPWGTYLHQLPVSWGPTIHSHRFHFAPSWSDLFALGWSLWSFARAPFFVAKYRGDLLWEDSCIDWWIRSIKHLCSNIVFKSAHVGNWLQLIILLLGLVNIILVTSVRRNWGKSDTVAYMICFFSSSTTVEREYEYELWPSSS